MAHSATTTVNKPPDKETHRLTYMHSAALELGAEMCMQTRRLFSWWRWLITGFWPEGVAVTDLGFGGEKLLIAYITVSNTL